MKKLLLIIGTRPEAIKMCPLARVLAERDRFALCILSTGQHREMLSDAFAAFSIRPHVSLSVMRGGQSLGALTATLLSEIGGVIDDQAPSAVLVHGDTCTAFAGALAAFYRHIPVCHVEAGLRTYDLSSPFPEELYREAISLMASLHFAPTEGARQNLLSEGRPSETVHVTGNTVIDALRYTVRGDYTHPLLIRTRGKHLILMTAHRRENLGEPMRGAFRVVRRVMDELQGPALLFPLHQNPAVRREAIDILGGHDRIFLTEPLSVLDFHNFLSRAHLVITDSGGIQEEAAHLCKPLLVLRNTTERPEGLGLGNARLVGTDEASVYANLRELLLDRDAYDAMVRASSPYGDGHASRRIADILESCFGESLTGQ